MDDLGKIIAATDFEKLPKVCNKWPNLVTLHWLRGVHSI